VDEAGQNQIVVAPGANMDLHAGDVEAMRRVFRGGRIAMFQLEPPLETPEAAMRVARDEKPGRSWTPLPLRLTADFWLKWTF
jgi:sugar/nucleoside kinase (ribokinase family)